MGVGLVMVTPASVMADTEKLSAAEYATNVCGVLTEVKAAEAVISGLVQSRGPVDFASSRQVAIDLVTTYQTAWRDAATALEMSAPNVSSAAKIQKIFVDDANEAVADLQKAIEEFKTFDPAMPGYAGAVSDFSVAATSARAQLGNPVKKITDRNVRKAFEREQTCVDLFPRLGKAGAVDRDIQITEFPVPTANAGPFGIVASADGNLWFTEVVGNKIGKIDPDTGKVTEYVLPANLATSGITAGPDGNLWVTERDTAAPPGSPPVAKLGKVDPETGVVAEVPTPTALPGTGGGVSVITTGPDGNVWFIENGNRIGKIDPESEAVTLFPIPTAGANPKSITLGPDGNLWFTESVEHQIGKIDPKTGKVTEFPIPPARIGTWGIAAGPDGNLWFTEIGANQIGRIDPDTGKVTEFSLPTPASGVFGIVAGCDGNLWFTEQNANQIGKLDPETGLVTEYPVPTANAQPFRIAAGPDGYLWFTEQRGNQIGKIGPIGEKTDKKFKSCLAKTTKP